MSKIIVALVIATLCQLGALGEEERVSMHGSFIWNIEWKSSLL